MSSRMYLWARYLGQGLCVSTLLVLPARAAVAQRTIALTAPASAEADKMHRQADDVMATCDRRHWKLAAGLLEQAAALRAPNDTVAIAEKLVAGQLFHHRGALARAQANLEGAAQQALANGRLLQSADAYLLAAVVANEQRHGQRAVDLARSAERLARSPHLTPAQSDGILDRIVWLPNNLVAVR